MDTIQLFKALADNSRLRLIQTLLEKPAYVELLAERLELKPSTVSFHLKKLQKVGLVSSEKEQYYTVYSLNKELLDRSLIELVSNTQQETEDDGKAKEEAYRKKVIKSFFRYDKLKQIPVQQKKRLIVLAHLAEQFEKDKAYTEKEVNELLGSWHEDFCTLRRELVTGGFMTRKDGIYRRV